jgi:hypothetical protein
MVVEVAVVVVVVVEVVVEAHQAVEVEAEQMGREERGLAEVADVVAGTAAVDGTHAPARTAGNQPHCKYAHCTRWNTRAVVEALILDCQM